MLFARPEPATLAQAMASSFTDRLAAGLFGYVVTRAGSCYLKASCVASWLAECGLVVSSRFVAGCFSDERVSSLLSDDREQLYELNAARFLGELAGWG